MVVVGGGMRFNTAFEIEIGEYQEDMRQRQSWITDLIVTMTLKGQDLREAMRGSEGRPLCPSLHMLGCLNTMPANKTDTGNNQHHDFHHIYTTIPPVYLYYIILSYHYNTHLYIYFPYQIYSLLSFSLKEFDKKTTF